jgi:hypothetical protein
MGVAAYLRCGFFQHGFARFACKTCGKERLVAYSCKNRGLCPSCIAKRSALTAAHLTDTVLPVCPYRQWTLAACLWRSHATQAPRAALPPHPRRRSLYQSHPHLRQDRVFLAAPKGQGPRPSRRAHRQRDLCPALRLSFAVKPSCPYMDPRRGQQDGGELSFVPLPRPTDEDVETLCRRLADRIARLCASDDEELLVDDEDAVMASVQAEGACVV